MKKRSRSTSSCTCSTERADCCVRHADGEERRGCVEEVIERERLRIRWRRESRPETCVDFVLAAAGTRLIVVESVSAPTALATTDGWDVRLFALELAILLRGATLLSA